MSAPPLSSNSVYATEIEKHIKCYFRFPRKNDSQKTMAPSVASRVK